MENLIVKYLNNEISPEELAELKEKLKDPGFKQLFEEYRKVNSLAELSIGNIKTDEKLKALEKAIGDRPNRVVRFSRQYFRYAAVFILAIAVVSVLSLIFKKGGLPDGDRNPAITLKLEDGTVKKITDDKPVITVDTYTRTKDINPETTKTNKTTTPLNELSVPYGKRVRVKLPDGSEVSLNAGSKLKYPSTFKEKGQRNVYLEGEGYFSVIRNEKVPFVVHTPKMDIEVLGTKFNVSSFSNDDRTTAVLVEGSVAVRETVTRKSVVIKPGQAAIAEDNGISVKKVEVSKYVAWTRGELLFIDDTFEDILKKLERHYNVSITNKAPSLNQVRYSGRFDTESIDQVLEAFKINTDFEYYIEKNRIIIKN
ncbi:FecR family protein [Sinomicrobium weinanense]|uniref:DUF4974 domain-containing protein n=1 Tax=Sinomicrobium weinanense TaxID=2842200 RepID=A0A926JQH4_9FLAO|nr:FecR domain-containing protein [Sinomicrobium weinanense]MBC9795432.1 DUF4974 domain-containing protein [Sinomicrobium weinanense]MBU3123957.1 DUF4974 domain-containing protein [Sinomicrobium weinanense]